MQKRALCLFLGRWLLGFVSFAAPALSGNTTISLSALPLPCTLVDETKLDTPCERTVFSWDLDIALRFALELEDRWELWLDAAAGFAGFEHVIFGGRGFLGEVEVKPELWLAIPFESVLDVNNLPNSAIISPGEMLFAAAQVQASWKVDVFDIRWTSVLQDINFPDPGRDYPYLHYGIQSQSFAMGTVVNVSTTLANDVGVGFQAGFGAEPGGFRVKGYSTSVRAVPDRLYARVSVNNIALNCPWCDSWGALIDRVRLGLSFAVEPKEETFMRVGGSIIFNLYKSIRVSTSFNMVVPEGIEWGGISVSAKTPVGSLNLHFGPEGEFKSGTLNMNYRTQLNLGWTSGIFTARATATSQQGISSASASLSLSQGTFSSNYNISYAYQSDRGLAFASFSLRFRLNLNPLQAGVHITFGRYGLGRFTVSTGYVF